MKTPDRVREFFKTCQLLVVDMDGTCLDGTGAATPATVEALHAVKARGIPVVPASGRNPGGIERAFGSLSDFDYLISSNGGLVTDARTGEILHQVLMEREVVADVVRDLMHPAVLIYVNEAGEGAPQLRGCAGKEEDIDFGASRRAPRRSSGFVPPPATPDLEQRVRAGTPFVQKIGISFGKPLTFEDIEAVTDRYPQVEAFRTSGHMVEVSARGANKGAGVAFLCGHLDIPTGQACAIGDHGNDVSMFRVAGLGVAMANASEEVRAAADFVTEHDNDHDGVARFLREYALG